MPKIKKVFGELENKIFIKIKKCFKEFKNKIYRDLVLMVELEG